MLLYTDGMTDAVGPDAALFGEERLLACAAEVPRDPESCCEGLAGRADAYAGDADRADDMTALALDRACPPDGERITAATSDAEAPETVLDLADALLSRAGCPEDARRSIDVAVDEICSNIANYAYPEGLGEYTVSAETAGNCVRLTFTDRGVPFDPLGEPAPGRDDDLSEGGIGIYLVRQVTDSVRYFRAGDENRLELLKRWR